MENKGLYAVMCILLLALGFSTGFAVAPSENIMINNVTDTEYVYVNNTVDESAMDNELFNKIYERELKELELENASLIAFAEEFDEKDLVDFLEDETSLKFDELKSFKEDVSEEEINITNLGLNDAEDAKVIVTKEFKVRYENTENTDTRKVTVYSTTIVTFDEDDGYEADITYSLSK